MTIYIENELGAVHSVTEEHYEKFLTARGVDGGVFPLPGITVITEEQAREKHPHLFGAWDPQVTFTPEELIAQRKYQKDLADFQQLHASNRKG
ncbi:hypothetical protein [Microbacterium xylanilyticum]